MIKKKAERNLIIRTIIILLLGSILFFSKSEAAKFVTILIFVLYNIYLTILLFIKFKRA